MKQLLSFLAFLCLAMPAWAQKKENRNFFKLYVVNDKKEVLLIKFEGAWEIPGASYAMSVPISVFLDSMGLQHGVTIDRKKLDAQITFHHDTRENPTIMLYYTAHYTGGTLKTPSWGQDVKWFSLKDAYSMIPYPEMVMIMKKLAKNKHTVWGGALRITYEDGRRTGYKVIEDLYELN